MKLLRKLLEKALGFEGYLRLVSKSYLWLTGRGMFKSKYPELFYLEKIIKPGFYCLDIGANLGYYSTSLSKLSGKNGHVYAVEPVPVFQQIWKDNVQMSGVQNLTLLPYALGSSNGTMQMGTPTRNGLVHHGMTKVVQPGQENYVHYYTVEMKVPDELFVNFPRLDFVKCDVEGYEHLVFSNMVQTLRKFKPLIQTELNGAENRQKVYDLLTGLGYKAHILGHGSTMVPVLADKVTSAPESDFYFLP